MRPLQVLLFCVVAAESLSAQAEGDKPIVWFVHGMVSIRESFDEEINVLKKIFPEAESVTLQAWKSPKMPLYKMGTAWSISLEEAERFVPELAQKIADLPEESRRRLILVGHSLGGRIVVRVAARCVEKGLKIRQVILAGSAIDNDDPQIANVLKFSTETVYNLINPDDALLLAYHIAGEQHAALGTGYLFSPDPKRFCEVVLDGTVFHQGYLYLEKFLECREKNDFSYPGVIVPQDYPNQDFATLGGSVWWLPVETRNGWRLQQNILTGHCRILDPHGIRRAWGRLEILRYAFQKVP